MKLFRKQREVAEIYTNLREQTLAIDLKEIDVKSYPTKTVFGVLMETGYKDDVVTLKAVFDGTVSLFFSHGGGIIGLGEYEGPRKACHSFLELANKFTSQFRPTNKYPLPDDGQIIFYFLTPNGILTARAKEKDLGNNRHSLSPLFHKAQEVITEARIVDEKRRKNTHDLLKAATTGQVSETKTLIDEGVNLNAADETGLTALMSAAYRGHLEVLELLLHAGALLDEKDASGYTALMFSCNSGQLECTRCLVENGAEVNAGANDGSTPLMFSTQHGHNEIVRLLLKNGADPSLKGTHGLSAIGFAQQNGLTETLKILHDHLAGGA